MAYIDPKNMNEQRDEFEWKIIRHTEEYRKPLLGICRGLQLVNVYFGGSLLRDIPSFGKISLETRLEQALNPFSRHRIQMCSLIIHTHTIYFWIPEDKIIVFPIRNSPISIYSFLEIAFRTYLYQFPRLRS